MAFGAPPRLLTTSELNLFTNVGLIRVKRRNAAAPDAVDEEFPLCITCTCKLGHSDIIIKWGRGGVAQSVKGNTYCWYNLFKFVAQGLGEDSETQVLRHWNATEKKWGTRYWSYDKVQKSMALWAAYCGVDQEPVNNCWARKTYRIQCSKITYIYTTIFTRPCCS